MKQSIEALAAVLLQIQVSFEYSKGYLSVTNSAFYKELFHTATYHNQTKKLVLMDDDYNEKEFNSVVDTIRDISKRTTNPLVSR